MIYKLKGIIKHNLWGGERLAADWNKDASGQTVGESWDLSLRDDGQCVIAEGEYKGRTLRSVLSDSDLGATTLERGYSVERFPIIIKFIDAHLDLSVQVHPRDSAKGGGKTEMWYIADCLPDSKLYIGFNKEMTAPELSRRVKDNTLQEVLNEVTVKKGDSYFIPAGTVHAIGKGSVVCEIQQNANTTYRLYDYGRVDHDGKCRELHIEQSLEVADLSQYAPVKRDRLNEIVKRISACDFFTVDEWYTHENVVIPTYADSFMAINFIEGEGRIGNLTYKKGDTFFVAANSPSITVCRPCRFLLTKML